MIVCHCSGITDHDIRAAVDWMRASDPMTIVTPGKIYHALGKRAECGGCMPLLLDTMRGCDSYGVPMNLRRLRSSDRRDAPHPRQATHEGRPQGHRLSERGAEV